MPETELDFNSIDEEYFYDIANIILNGCYLLVKKTKFRIMEIEFYLKCKSHNDPYTHCDPDQLLMHTFYFHKFKTGTYKAGTFKGMDLTFGSEKDNAYFGILVRCIQNIKTGDIIEGPCNVVNRILKEYKCNSIMEFTGGENMDIFENDKDFVLVPTDELENLQIAAGPRIGLGPQYPEFKLRRYRFVINKDKIKKGKTSLVYLEV
ncbi:hypothetical protein QJ856_gp0193 [Tupanvirus deep ocean]|uniref:Uncharacterized protein n=2 Tax=Tupanvirus TaxID=2094720 RepID=A0AC62A9V7_9VIRU|nr:hypothetical protein QJ856_gp0193 [Tupanvirus deep ocean]QKU34535.1 hypothetical protein [Tupanvirus deep ocean]